MKTLWSLTIFAALIQCGFAETISLRVGFIGGFSGPGSVYGQPCRNGFELGRAETGRNSLQVIYEDDQFVAAKTVAAFRKLTEVDRVDVLIVLGSIPSAAVAPLAQHKQVPTFAWTGDPGVSRGRSWIVRTWSSAVAEGQKLATEAAARRYNRIALLSSADNYSRAVKDGLQAAYPGEILIAEEFPADNMDFRTILTQLKSKSLTHAGICLASGQSAALAKQGLELGLRLKTFGCETLSDAQEGRL